MIIARELVNTQVGGASVQFLFADHRLDTARRELRRGSKPIAVEPQVFDLLIYLVQNCDRVVSKDDLIDSVWSGRVVSDSALTSRINAARRAIGDSGGEQKLIRTIARRGFRFVGAVRMQSNGDETAAPPAELGEDQSLDLPLAGPPAIAVLPFLNMSGDLEQEYFSDGISEDIITALCRYPSLFVIARNSSFAFKGRSMEVKQVGRALGVRYLLEGSLRRAGNRIRVTAQLVEAETGNHVWAVRYDRDLADIFVVQDEITEAVTIAVAPAIAQAEQQRAMRKPPGNLDAWAAYQRGLWHLEKTTPNDNALADSYFRQAIDLDPNFPGGYTGLAYAHRRAAVRRGLPATESMETARSAVRLDPNDAEARVCLGFMLLWQGNLTGAFAESEAALTLSPNLASAHGLMGSVLNWSGQWARARATLENSIRLDPRNPHLSTRYNAVTIGYYLSGDYEAAIKAAKLSIRAYPERENDYRWLAAALGQLGRVEEAREALEQAIAIAPAAFDGHVCTRVPWRRLEYHAHMLDGLRKAGWEG